MKQEKKTVISDALTLAMGKVGFALISIVLVVGLPVYGLYQLAGQFEYNSLRWVAVGLVLLIPLAGAVGFAVARLEVRGFLGGFDKGLSGVSQAVNLRDNSKVRLQTATATRQTQAERPDINVYLPPAGAMPTIAHRQLTQNNEVIEL